MVEEWHSGANVLLAYWHYCNKGFQPFAAEGDARALLVTAGLSPPQTEFIKYTSRYVKANGNTPSLVCSMIGL